MNFRHGHRHAGDRIDGMEQQRKQIGRHAAVDKLALPPCPRRSPSVDIRRNRRDTCRSAPFSSRASAHNQTIPTDLTTPIAAMVFRNRHSSPTWKSSASPPRPSEKIVSASYTLSVSSVISDADVDPVRADPAAAIVPTGHPTASISGSKLRRCSLRANTGAEGSALESLQRSPSTLRRPSFKPAESLPRALQGILAIVFLGVVEQHMTDRRRIVHQKNLADRQPHRHAGFGDVSPSVQRTRAVCACRRCASSAKKPRPERRLATAPVAEGAFDARHVGQNRHRPGNKLSADRPNRTVPRTSVVPGR